MNPNKIECNICGTMITKKNLNKHKRTKKCSSFIMDEQINIQDITTINTFKELLDMYKCEDDGLKDEFLELYPELSESPFFNSSK